jgi:hypothetical protein
LSVLVAKTLNYRKPCFSHPTWDDGSVRSDICQLGGKGEPQRFVVRQIHSQHDADRSGGVLSVLGSQFRGMVI